MASVFVQRYESKASPRVGVLSIGSEDAKGVELTTQTLEQVRQTDLNVVGNIEGNDIFNDSVDVVVTDGFTGNVVLKASEGVASALTTIIKEGVKQSFWAKIGALLMKPAFTHLKNRSHWTVVGGVVLLGVDGVVIIGHGKSNRIAVANALKQCARCIDTELLEHLRQMVAGHAAPPRKASFFTSVRKIFGGSGDDDKNPQAEAQE
jgi:glycerol-3-phosphate acyltransferase PlsX